MAIVGRKPKPEDQRRNQNQRRHEWIEVERRPHRGGPRLPLLQPDGEPWPEATRRWWGVIRRMPHCVLWEEADWAYALDTAVVAARFHAGSLPAAAELRLREKALGTTLDARRDLRIRYIESANQEKSASVTAIEDYRRVLS